MTSRYDNVTVLHSIDQAELAKSEAELVHAASKSMMSVELMGASRDGLVRYYRLSAIDRPIYIGDMNSSESGVRLHWGPNTLMFPNAEEARAFAEEMGCVSVSYWSFWQYAVAS